MSYNAYSQYDYNIYVRGQLNNVTCSVLNAYYYYYDIFERLQFVQILKHVEPAYTRVPITSWNTSIYYNSVHVVFLGI